MKLWILRAKDNVDYDSYDSFVIEAETEQDAREMAQQLGSDECFGWDEGGRKKLPFWTDPKYSTCKKLKPTGKAGVVIGSFNAG